MLVYCWFFFFFFKQKTAYEMRISDWSSDVCSSDLHSRIHARAEVGAASVLARASVKLLCHEWARSIVALPSATRKNAHRTDCTAGRTRKCRLPCASRLPIAKTAPISAKWLRCSKANSSGTTLLRSEEHTSELQSLMRISYAVFCLKKKNIHYSTHYT